jgi:hypothetical protein
MYATPDHDCGIDEIEKLLGVRATLAGKHPGRGTKNAFIALGPNSFLEIVAPDPDQPPPKDPRAFLRPYGIKAYQMAPLTAVTSRSKEIGTNINQ